VETFVKHGCYTNQTQKLYLILSMCHWIFQRFPMNQDEVNIGQDCAFVLESNEIGEAHGEL
jgi:hypothetical protein